MKITIEMGEDEYRLVGVDGAGEKFEGDIVEYGLPAVLDMDGEKLMAYIEDPEAEDEELGQHVYKLTPVAEETVEEVEFDIPDEEDEEEEKGNEAA